MADTAVAVEQVVTEAFAPPPETPAPVVDRAEVKERIANIEWKDEDVLRAERTSAPPTTEDTPDEASPTQGQSPAKEPQLDSSEPPPEAVLDDGAGRIVVRGADGKYSPAPEVKLEFAVGDKVYLKSPSELVRMARDGVAGQQAAMELKQYRDQWPTVQEQFQRLQDELQAQVELNRAMLNDEAQYYEHRAEWQEMNAPEARLARMEEERAREQAQRRTEEVESQRFQQVQTYYNNNLKPVQDELLGGYEEVSLEAKMGRIALDTLPLMENGVIPPHRLPEYRAYLDGPFRQWLMGQVSQASAAEAARKAERQQDQRKAQQVVQSVGRQLQPNGKAAPDAPPPPRAPRSRDEAKMNIINRPWQEV